MSSAILAEKQSHAVDVINLVGKRELYGNNVLTVEGERYKQGTCC
jgi:hypothetical protein